MSSLIGSLGRPDGAGVRCGFIGGAYVSSDAELRVEDPCTGGALAACGAATDAQADAAVKAAAAAQPAWAALGLAARAAILRKLADGVDAAKPRLAAMESLNTGKPLREAEADVDDVRFPRAAP